MTARWPTDYASLDGGRLFVHPAFLDSLPWRNLDAVMSADVNVVRKVGRRDNCRIVLGPRDPHAEREDYEGSEGTCTAYLKRHWHSRWSFLQSRPPGIWEADAVGWCQAADAPTMKVIAAGGDRQRSFFLSEEIAGGVPADDYWRANPDKRVREQVLTAMADTARRFHAAGLYHRDFYWCHFFILSDSRDSKGSAPLRVAANQDFSAHLIDLQRVIRRPWLGWRWRVKDLGQFWYSAPDDVTDDDRKLWFETYSHTQRRSGTERAAMIRAGFYRLKDGRP
jgi:hypothetical protein